MATTTPTETVTTTSNIPSWAQPYASQLFGQVFGYGGQGGLLQQGYQQYDQPMVAGFNPLQKQAFGDLAAMGVSPQTTQASGLAGLAGLQAQQAGQYRAARPTNFYNPMDVSYLGTSAGQFGGAEAGQYMSPYMQNVVEQQKRQAVQDYARQIPGLQAQGIRSGARGGTREALLQSEAQRNLMGQLQGIQATGTQQAFQQAQQQFNADQARALQAQQANQQAQLQAQQQALGQRQAAAQYGLSGAQLGESSRQFGANLGMEGLRQQLAAAQTLGGLGQQQYQQGLGINQAQLGAGAQIQALEQQQLAQRYQDFINQQQFPYKQLEFASGILRGYQPTGTTQTLYQAPGSTLGQIAGLATGLGGLFGGIGSPTTGTK